MGVLLSRANGGKPLSWDIVRLTDLATLHMLWLQREQARKEQEHQEGQQPTGRGTIQQRRGGTQAAVAGPSRSHSPSPHPQPPLALRHPLPSQAAPSGIDHPDGQQKQAAKRYGGCAQSGRLASTVEQIRSSVQEGEGDHEPASVATTLGLALKQVHLP